MSLKLFLNYTGGSGAHLILTLDWINYTVMNGYCQNDSSLSQRKRPDIFKLHITSSANNNNNNI